MLRLCTTVQRQGRALVTYSYAQRCSQIQGAGPRQSSLVPCVHTILSLPSFYVTTISSTFTISFLQILFVKARLTRPDIP